MTRLPGNAVESRGSGAPMSTHVARSAMTSGGSISLGGIFVFSWRTAWTSRLSFDLPGTTAGPVSPPARTPSRLSSRRLPLSFLFLRASSEWHE
jgi:hypothetical protein